MPIFDVRKVCDAIVSWIADYFSSSASPQTKAIVGISGGKDSSVVAALCKKALGPDRVYGVLMPQGNQFDINFSYDVCNVLGIEYSVINIENAVNSIYNEILDCGLSLNTLVTFNTPARVRMATLYAVAASHFGRVANTSNLSEDFVGYATKFGDSAGDFSPISSLTVTEVKAVGTVLGLPIRFIEKTPIDGLCNTTDEDNLGFSYAVLDRYIRENVCEDTAIKAKIDALHQSSRHKFLPMPSFDVNKFLNKSN